MAHPIAEGNMRASGGSPVRLTHSREVFAEKIRALGERGRPRDLYGVIFRLFAVL